MKQDQPTPRWTTAAKSALPAMALGVVLLLPFLNAPFTIDDPVFLQEARQILRDPLHPQAFDMVWTFDVWARASQIIQGGLAAGYLLVPAALAGYSEVVGHLTTLLFLLAALWATAMAGLRLGLSPAQARWAALLTGAAPAVLGMAGTVMPDIPAMAFSVLGMERMLAWREHRRWGQAAGAAAWLLLAALTREHTALLLAGAAVLALDGVGKGQVRASVFTFPQRFLPIAMVPLAYFVVTRLTADPNPGSRAPVEQIFTDWDLTAKNAVAFFSHWCIAAPFAIPWIVLRGERALLAALFLVLLGAGLARNFLGWNAVPAAVGLVALADLGIDGIRRRDRDRLAMLLWMLPGLAPAFYLHLPSKYLLPSMPAAALLLAQLLPATSGRLRQLVPATVVAAGALVGLLILTGNRSLAEAERTAAEELIAPRVKNGERVLFLGHWGFHWYAEKAGARPATTFDPAPQPGDTIVVSFADNPLSTHRDIRRRVLDERSDIEPGGRVMDLDAHAGFFSNGWGPLPWAWGRGETNRFEVWKVE